MSDENVVKTPKIIRQAVTFIKQAPFLKLMFCNEKCFMSQAKGQRYLIADILNYAELMY